MIRNGLPPLNYIHTWSLECLGDTVTRYDGTNNDMGALSGGVWPVANLGLFYPFTIDFAITVRKMWLMNASGAANIDLGVYDRYGTRLVSTGSVAKATSDGVQTIDVTDTKIGPGGFYLSMSCSNTSGFHFRTSAGGLSLMKAAGVMQMASALALPASATFAAFAGDGTNAFIPMFGLSVRTEDL